MPRLSAKTLKKRIAMLQRIKEHNQQIIEQLLKEHKFKDEKIAWYRKKLRMV